MCGIIAYVGNRAAAPILLQGLASLEYRGYDSSGIALLDLDGNLSLRRAPGKLQALIASMDGGFPEGNVGIGHTRWATHGSPTEENSHPHTDCLGDVVVVHNGIVENYLDLKKELASQGHVFDSQTDSEVVAHLIESRLSQGYSFEESVRMAALQLKGANAIMAMNRRDPSKILAFRQGNAGGIVVGYGRDEMLLASDLPALLPHTRKVAYLANGEVVSITQNQAEYNNLDGSAARKDVVSVPYDPLSAAKGRYKHFMLKEINEQPEALLGTFRGRVSFEEPSIGLEGFPFSDQQLLDFSRIVLVGMGTSLHAAMVGRYWFEALAGIPTEVDNASEFRYRDPIVDGHTLVVSVSQSGETADTLAAMEEVARKGAPQITVCNIEGSQASRLAQWTLYIRAGLEIGVASTKTFPCSMAALLLLAAYIGVRRGAIGKERLRECIQELAQLPQKMGHVLEDQPAIEKLAGKFFKHSNFLYLGRGALYPLAMEGALKLKEVSYLHAEGYPAGEMKHGPIALIDEEMPVVALAPLGPLYDKMLNSINEVKARGGTVIAVATQGDQEISEKADHVIYLPQASPLVTPILAAAPMQLLAYYIAVRRGCDVDQPRNLAKSVTVE